MKQTYRIVALFLVLALCVQMFPTTTFAQEDLPKADSELTVENSVNSEPGVPGTMVVGVACEEPSGGRGGTGGVRADRG